MERLSRFWNWWYTRYWRENITRSFDLWDRGDRVGVIIAAFVALGLTILSIFGIKTAVDDWDAGPTILLSLGVWFIILITLVTPARLWRGEQRAKAKAESELIAEQRRVSAGPEMLKHKDTLSVPLEELRAVVGPITVGSRDLWQWLISAEESWPVPGGRIHGTPHHADIRLHTEKDERWERLSVHLEGDSLWPLIQAWKQAVQDDLDARYDLVQAISDKLRQSLPQLPLSKDISGDHGGAPHIHPHSILEILDRTFREDSRPLLETDIRKTDSCKAESSAGLLFIASSESEVGEAVTALTQIAKEARNWPETKSARGIYQNSIVAGETLKSELARVHFSTGFPVGTTCDYCDPSAISPTPDTPDEEREPTL